MGKEWIGNGKGDSMRGNGNGNRERMDGKWEWGQIRWIGKIRNVNRNVRPWKWASGGK